MNPSRKVRGSVLVFSLIVLAFMLISALSLAAISVTDKRSSFSTERSSRSFQVADSGVEIALKEIYTGSHSTLDALASSLGSTCNSQGEIKDTINSGEYTLSFYDNADVKFTGTDCSAPDWRDRLVKLKSDGMSGNTTRAVEVAVKAVP